MKKFICLSSIIIFIVNLQSQWIQIPNNNYTFYFALGFVNQYTGWAGGNDSGKGSIYYTSNGGANWVRQLYSSPAGRIECIFFINSLTGWAGAYSGEVYLTTNGGVNWTSTLVTINRRIRKLYFVNSSTGYFTGEAGCYKTTNGGNSWYNAYFNNYVLYGLYFFNQNTGVVGGVSNIFKTTDGGTNFFHVHNAANNIALYDFDFINSSTGYCGGSRCFTIKTVNGGTNWTDIYSELTTQWINNYYDIDFVDVNLGYAAGQFILSGPGGTTYSGFFYKTTNGGLNWSGISLGVSVYSYEAVQICEGQIGYMAGYSGKIFKSTNAGYIGIQPISSEIPDRFSLSQNYPNPFNPVTRIRFSLPHPSKGGAQEVKLIVYDILGREVVSLIPPFWGGKEGLKPGTYEVDFDGTELPSGVYFYKLITYDFLETKKMVLIK